MGICLSCLGLRRNSSDSDPDDEAGDPLLRHTSNNRPYGAFHSSTSSLTNALKPPQDPERLRREAEALERICADTADKLIDISQNFGASKIDSDFDRLFSEAFSPGLLAGPGPGGLATQVIEEEEGEDGEDERQRERERERDQVQVQVQKASVSVSPDIAMATNEQEWLRAVLSAAKKEQESGGEGGKNWDAGFVAEIDRPLTLQFDG